MVLAIHYLFPLARLQLRLRLDGESILSLAVSFPGADAFMDFLPLLLLVDRLGASFKGVVRDIGFLGSFSSVAFTTQKI